MPVLRELNIDIQSPEEESLLIQALPKLTVLNGHRLGESDDRPNRPDMREEADPVQKQEKGIEPNKITSEDLDKVAVNLNITRRYSIW